MPTNNNNNSSTENAVGIADTVETEHKINNNKKREKKEYRTCELFKLRRLQATNCFAWPRCTCACHQAVVPPGLIPPSSRHAKTSDQSSTLLAVAFELHLWERDKLRIVCLRFRWVRFRLEIGPTHAPQLYPHSLSQQTMHSAFI